jgi:DNA primase
MRGDAQFDAWVAKARSMRIEREIERRGIKLERMGNELIGPCPKCGGVDRFAANLKKQVWNCRQGEKGGDVIALVMHLDNSDFSAACETLAGPKPSGKPVAKTEVTRHDYLDENQKLDRVVFRTGHGDNKKVWQKRPDRDHPGRLKNGAAGCRDIPYRLPELTEAMANGHCIAVVEGEGKADLLASWNVAATCNPCGAKKWKTEHAAFLKDADVIILPDNDPVGFEHADIVARSLVGVAKRIRRVDLPGLPHKGDIVDWAAAGRTREELDELVAEAPDWTAPAAKQKDNVIRFPQSEEGRLDAIAKMRPGIKRSRERARLAKDLGVNKSDIDKEIEARQAEGAKPQPLHDHWIAEPWPEPVDTDVLLRDNHPEAPQARRHTSRRRLDHCFMDHARLGSQRGRHPQPDAPHYFCRTGEWQDNDIKHRLVAGAAFDSFGRGQ